MSVPSVSLTELDGQLGIVPISAGSLQCLVGDAQTGPLNTPAAFARVKDVLATFTGGPLVEDACYAIERYGAVVVLCRTERTTDGAASSVDDTLVTGTSVPSVDVVTDQPWYSGEWVFEVLLGGTLGTGPISFRYSDDGERTWSKKISLGTALTYTVPNSGVVVDFAAGTLVTADKFSFTTTEPKWDASDLAAALEAVRLASALPIESVSVIGECSGTEKDTINSSADLSHTSNRHRFFVCRARLGPETGETEAEYLTDLAAEFASVEHTSVIVAAGAARIGQRIPGRPSQARRSSSQAAAPRIQVLSAEQNPAKILPKGPLPGVAIKDSNGNPIEHDEEANPGLDDAGFLTLRGFTNRNGAFINRARIQAPSGSDFELVMYRRVMNDARTAIQIFLENAVLNKDILVHKESGFILETEALDIEAGANAVLDSVLLTKPKASAAIFVLDRNDNILSTKTLHYSVRITPLGYAELVEGDIALVNPANVVTV